MRWVYLMDYVALKKAGGGVTPGDRLDRDTWLDILGGRLAESTRVTTAV